MTEFKCLKAVFIFNCFLEVNNGGMYSWQFIVIIHKKMKMKSDEDVRWRKSDEDVVIKVGLSPSKKNFICFIKITLKMMKNVFFISSWKFFSFLRY